LEDVSLVIAPIKNIIVDYDGDVKDEFGEGDQQQLITGHFRNELLKRLGERSSFKDIKADSFSKEPSWKEATFDLGDIYHLRMDLPSDSNTIDFTSGRPDFVLFIQDLYIGCEYKNDGSFQFGDNGNLDKSITVSYPQSGSGRSDFQAGSFSIQGSSFQPPVYSPPMPMMNTYSSPKTKYLRYRCNFAFWDNNKHRVVAYGRINAQSRAESHGLGVVQIIRMPNWNEIDNGFIHDLIDNTPFRKH
jgi:hypothetical protein